ncbi:ThiF family adenylyltransferase [Frankia sp. QA3]|uniref:HesA/MoeB/ThiF family protein n=1 Tax=Frankia sp. QA3 TaxID=710111 RepID=UPI000269BF24|nr:ThiF family adenylyltransferase [Frankia sp. QA3]EIV91493.1 dinucleotide-utilizing enzyme possibly involved in molybdopterin or thiamin biosynthesis [Frankia sp. QA3]
MCSDTQVTGHERDAAAETFDSPEARELLTAATAVVVGVGALGNEVAKNLALAGVGRLVLCDPDTVAATNLNRTVLFRPDDVGRPKVEAARDALARLAPTVRVDARPAELSAGVGLGELADADVTLGCLDSRRARLRLLGRAALVDAPLVDGGTQPWGGEVRVRLSAAEPCYACSLTPQKRAVSDVPWSCADLASTGPAPASVLATAIIAGWMTASALPIILARRGPGRAAAADGVGRGVPAAPFQLLRIDGLAATTTPIGLRRDPACPHHHPLAGVVHPLALGVDSCVADLLARLPPGSEPLGWETFPLPGQCRGCGEGEESTDPGKVMTTCRRCGRVNRARRSDRLRDAGPGRALHELGVAPGEILAVRDADGACQWYRLATTPSAPRTAVSDCRNDVDPIGSVDVR